MSALNVSTPLKASPHGETPSESDALLELTGPFSNVEDVVENVRQKTTPVWPLNDYVAVNPYAGYAEQEFLSAREALRKVSDCEILMPVDYYREQFATGTLTRSDIDAAVDELVADGVAGAEQIDVNQVVALLRRPGTASPRADMPMAKPVNSDRRLRTFAEALDQISGSEWSRLILEEIAKHCASHYDEGQALWRSPWRDLPLYQAWLSSVEYDRSFAILGVPALRKLATSLPHDPHSAIVRLLRQLAVPEELWEELLLGEALTMPGWSAWANYRHIEAQRRGDDNTDFAGLLAIRLAHEVALSDQFSFRVDWNSTINDRDSLVPGALRPTNEELLRYALLKASEIAYRKQLIAPLAQNPESTSPDSTDSRLAQIVFCIDVRSERIRRHLEAQSSDVETFGFAGFFGLPIEFVELGETNGSPQVPVLISPKFKVYEEVDAEDGSSTESAIQRRTRFRALSKSWKRFQASAASCFAFVETTGMFYGLKLLMQSMAAAKLRPSRFDGVNRCDHSRLAPTLRGLEQQGVCAEKQADMAESVLRGIGIVKDFAKLVVFCGHGSKTENNPLQAGLDCGACGGHSGEPNARFAARLLNQEFIRKTLAERGIAIPHDTYFVAALHNTTTDEIQFLDEHRIPRSHQSELQQLRVIVASASQHTRLERLPSLPGRNPDDLFRRSRDWSEVRPEWGLAGNAAFIAAPRNLTKSIPLDGRAFLHSYDHRNDRNFAVLEQIMTAPLVVANWINMQYYASTVDPIHFGSGNKTVHNVVGRFGIFSGNGGDLMTGLPWQSIHDGQRYQHHPLRLLAVIAAPRQAIEAILEKHDTVKNLIAHGWVQLVAVEDGDFYRYTEQCSWRELNTAVVTPTATKSV